MTTEMSPRAMARVIGVCYLITIVAGVVAQGAISESLINGRDAAATATNILNNTFQYRMGFTVYLIEMAAQVAMTTLLYELLKPVSRSVSLLSAVLGLVGCTIKIVARLFYYAPLFVLGGALYLNSFTREQREALALFLLKVNDQGAAIALVFFGLDTVLKGYLILQSTFLPRFLGVLGVIGGVGWLAFLWPPLGLRLFPVIALAGLVGALAAIGWFLIVGVNDERWRTQASVAQASIWR
jgi:hypothetical protein